MTETVAVAYAQRQHLGRCGRCHGQPIDGHVGYRQRRIAVAAGVLKASAFLDGVGGGVWVRSAESLDLELQVANVRIIRRNDQRWRQSKYQMVWECTAARVVRGKGDPRAIGGDGGIALIANDRSLVDASSRRVGPINGSIAVQIEEHLVDRDVRTNMDRPGSEADSYRRKRVLALGTLTWVGEREISRTDLLRDTRRCCQGDREQG